MRGGKVVIGTGLSKQKVDHPAHRLILHVTNGCAERMIGAPDWPTSLPYILLAFTQVESTQKLANPSILSF
jgi:hypothetical protein